MLCVYPIYSGRQTGQEEGHTGFHYLPSAVLALIFISQEGFSRSFPSSTVKSNFVYPRNNRSPLVGRYLFIIIFW